MHDMEAKNHPTRSVDYPLIHLPNIDKLKLVLLFAAEYLKKWAEITVIFVSYDSLATGPHRLSAAAHPMR